MLKFKEWLGDLMEARKLYKLRLDPEDAEYGLSRKTDDDKERTRGAYSGSPFSMVELEAWKAAWQNTAAKIYDSLPPEVKKGIKEIRRKLPDVRPDARCNRCGGTGNREDKEHWISFQGQINPNQNPYRSNADARTLGGKVCFKCSGYGIEPSMEPVFFRRHVIDHIKEKISQRDYKAIASWGKKVLKATDEEQVYKPVLKDIAELAVSGRIFDIPNLPH